MLAFRKETEYALRFLQYLAKNKQGCCSLSKFAANSGISFYFMQKIARKLTRQSVIKAIQGVHGGYGLKMPAKKLTFYNIVNIMEDGIKLLPCMNNIKDCKKKLKKCQTRTITYDLNTKIIKAMQNIQIVN